MSSVAYVKRWRLDRERGVSHTPVPIERVRAHVQRLNDMGVSRAAVAAAAQVSPSTITRIMAGRNHQGPQRGVQRDQARRILAVTPAACLARPRPRDFVLAIGTKRRLRALMALGWRHEDISRAMGRTGTPTCDLLNDTGPYVARANHDAVVRAYDALSMRPGPSEVARRRALRAGYLPPLAWDDEQLDDPAAVPSMDFDLVEGAVALVDQVAVDEVLAGRPQVLNRAERERALPDLVTRGLSDLEIARLVGCVQETVRRTRNDLGLASCWVTPPRTEVRAS